jgi:hypothetical protein
LRLLLATWLYSFAALGQPLDVVVGDDLTAWRSISEQAFTPVQLIENYEQFITSYPTSSLSEVALTRVTSLRRSSAINAESSLKTVEIDRIEQSQEAHRQRLERDLSSAAIVELAGDGTLPAPVSSPWHMSLHAGANWIDSSVAAVTGAEFRYRPVGVIARIGAGEQLYFQSALRLTAPGWGPFGELSYDTRQATSFLAGGRHALKHKLWLELSGGVQYVENELGPVVRLELVQGL